MLKVGITGGIGSGKSTVCKIFELLGIPVYYADEKAKILMQKDKVMVACIKKLFGKTIYSKKKQLRRNKLSQIVFNDINKLTALNEIVHPVVKKDFLWWTKQQKHCPYVIKEAALLFESGSDTQLDKIITVFAPQNLRLKRIMHRDNTARELVEARIKNQMDDKKKLKLADYIIYNDEKNMIIPQVLKMHEKFLTLLRSGLIKSV